MKILVISDIHENFDNLMRVLKKIPDLWVEKIFCLWDLINGWIWRILAKQDIPVHLIWWNNDWCRVKITKLLLQAQNGSQVANDEFDVCEIDGRKIFLTHYPIIARSIAKSGDYDAVFYGHDHVKHVSMVDTCLLVNPWEIWADKTGTASYVVYDTETNTAKIFDLENSVSTRSKEVSEYMKELDSKKIF